MKQEWNEWHIVLDPLASSPDRYAANELQTYIRRTSGQLVKIVEVVEPFEPHLRAPLTRYVFVGPSRLLTEQCPETAAIPLGDDETLIKREGDALVLTGGGKRGPLYAVYAFLERYLGCRFFTEDDELVPTDAPPLPETFEYRSAPAFATRDTLALYSRSGPWAAKLRLNGHFANVTSLQGFKNGLFPFVHTFAHIVRPEQWFKKHPEYFSLINGERNPKQLCLSNAKVQKLVIEQVMRWIDENPDYDIFSISENDGGGFCECDDCWKMNGKEVREAYGQPSQPGSFFRFVNLVADVVGKHHPDKWIDTLSYSYYNLTPPRHFQMAPNVMVRVCMNVDGRNRLRKWLKAASRVGIWHYFTYRHFMLPFPLIMGSIPTVLREFRDLGVKDVMLQMPEDEHGGVESTKLQLYATSKLFWDVDEDPTPHVREFVRFYYGPAADAMQKVFDLTQSVLKKHGAQWDCWTWTMDTVPPLRRAMPILRKRVEPLLREARGRTRGNSTYGLRVAEATLPFQYFEMLREDRPPRFTATTATPMDTRPVRRPVLNMVRTLQQMHVEYWHHDYTLKVLEQAIQPQPLVRLKSQALEALVLPGTGGRIVQVIDRRTNRELMPVGINLFEFESSGYEEYVGRWHHGPGYREAYAVARQGRSRAEGQWVLLRADLKNGFRIERRIAVRGNELRLRSVLTNRSAESETGELRLHGRWSCDPAVDRIRVERTDNGVEEGCLAEFKNREVDAFDGERIVCDLASLGVRIEHSLPGRPARKLMVLSRDKAPDGQWPGHVVTDVFTKPKKLAPGGSMTVDQVYRIESNTTTGR